MFANSPACNLNVKENKIELEVSNLKGEFATLTYDEYSKEAFVIVPDDQLSLAIGRDGQNVRLAHKLTGWKIDIKSVSQAEKMEYAQQHQHIEEHAEEEPEEDEVDEIAEEIREQEEYAMDDEDIASIENEEEQTEEAAE